MTPVDINVDKNVYLESIYISIIKVKKLSESHFCRWYQTHVMTIKNKIVIKSSIISYSYSG